MDFVEWIWFRVGVERRELIVVGLWVSCFEVWIGLLLGLVGVRR